MSLGSQLDAHPADSTHSLTRFNPSTFRPHLFARLLAGDAGAFGVHALDGAAFVVPPLGGPFAWVVGAFWVLVGHFLISRHRIRIQKRCGDERKIANRLHTPQPHANVGGLRRSLHRSRGR